MAWPPQQIVGVWTFYLYPTGDTSYNWRNSTNPNRTDFHSDILGSRSQTPLYYTTISYHVFEDNLFVVRSIAIATRLEFIITFSQRSICVNVYDWKKARR